MFWYSRGVKARRERAFEVGERSEVMPSNIQQTIISRLRLSFSVSVLLAGGVLLGLCPLY